jgi:hypothetical protein
LSARWEGDASGRGVADAVVFAGGASQIVDAMRIDGWVAEDPDKHLLHHLQSACASSLFELVAASAGADGVYDVQLKWLGDGRIGAIRAAIFTLVGSISETATYVRQRGGRTFEVVTGFVEGDSSFAPHGHTVRFEVER